jgi:SHS2 domain-containing protein
MKPAGIELEAPQPYDSIAHTADAGVEVHGASKEQTLARLVLALADVATGGEVAAGSERRAIEVAGGAELCIIAIDVLRAVHRLLALERLVPNAVRVDSLSREEGARLALRCGPFDGARHSEGLDIKAVTYHASRFEEQSPGSFVARAVFDI